jgi:hypothetical protein
MSAAAAIEAYRAPAAVDEMPTRVEQLAASSVARVRARGARALARVEERRFLARIAGRHGVAKGATRPKGEGHGEREEEEERREFHGVRSGAA